MSAFRSGMRAGCAGAALILLHCQGAFAQTRQQAASFIDQVLANGATVVEQSNGSTALIQGWKPASSTTVECHTQLRVNHSGIAIQITIDWRRVPGITALGGPRIFVPGGQVINSPVAMRFYPGFDRGLSIDPGTGEMSQRLMRAMQMLQRACDATRASGF